MNEKAPSGSDLTAVLAILPKLTRKELAAVSKKADELDRSKANEERREALRQIHKLAKEHGIDVKGKRGRPAKGKQRRRDDPRAQNG